MTHSAYRGTGPAINDALGGRVQEQFGGVPALIQHVKSGRLRGVGVTTEHRSNAAPDIPAIAETLPGYEASLWFGIWGPKGVPKTVVDRWIKELNRIVQIPEVQERMAWEGLDPVSKGPEPFRRVIAADVVKWRLVVEQASLKN